MSKINNTPNKFLWTWFALASLLNFPAILSLISDAELVRVLLFKWYNIGGLALIELHIPGHGLFWGEYGIQQKGSGLIGPEVTGWIIVLYCAAAVILMAGIGALIRLAKFVTGLR